MNWFADYTSHNGDYLINKSFNPVPQPVQMSSNVYQLALIMFCDIMVDKTGDHAAKF